MAWNTLRNYIVASGATHGERGRRKLIAVKNVLVVNGWTLEGSGNGIASYSMAGVDHCTAWNTCAVGSWVWLKNLEGAEIVMWINTDETMVMRASCTVGYAAGSGEAAATPPGNTIPPIDEIQSADTTHIKWSDASAHTCSMLVDLGKSFVVFGRVSAAAGAGAVAFVKLEETQTGDPAPYWLMRQGHAAATGEYSVTYLIEDWTYQSGQHPTTGVQRYGAMALVLPVDPMINLPVNLAGDVQQHEVWIGCATAGSHHVRGKLPSIYRVAATTAQGTHLFNHRFVVCDALAFPWNSTDALAGI